MGCKQSFRSAKKGLYFTYTLLEHVSTKTFDGGFVQINYRVCK